MDNRRLKNRLTKRSQWGLDTSEAQRRLILWSGAAMTHTVSAEAELQNSISTAAKIIFSSLELWRTQCKEQVGGFISKMCVCVCVFEVSLRKVFFFPFSSHLTLFSVRCRLRSVKRGDPRERERERKQKEIRKLRIKQKRGTERRDEASCWEYFSR
ncbi:hypothetical protein DFJ73DRAFT_38678 [Zopfochytrium polystomum]|nr:hypothetical protein DFJ73DRAFT_38678 [Zopfochytrium polystomum]